MKLDGVKLSNILEAINQNHEVSMYYKRWLLREGYISRDKKPIEGRGRPGYYYSLTKQGMDAIASVRGPEYVATTILGG